MVRLCHHAIVEGEGRIGALGGSRRGSVYIGVRWDFPLCLRAGPAAGGAQRSAVLQRGVRVVASAATNCLRVSTDLIGDLEVDFQFKF